MSKKVFTLGLASIKGGAVGTAAGSLAAFGYTYQDSCKMTQEDAETTDFFAEEVDDPVVSTSRAGKTTFEFSLMDPSPDTMEDLMGGTAGKTSQEATENDKWDAPDKAPNIEMHLEITPEQGLKFDIARAKVEAKINAEFSKKGILLIDVKATVLKPSAGAKLVATVIPAATANSQS